MLKVHLEILPSMMLCLMLGQNAEFHFGEDQHLIHDSATLFKLEDRLPLKCRICSCALLPMKWIAQAEFHASIPS